MRFTPLLFSPLVALATLCVAAPKYNMLDVYTPSILMPVEGDVWPVNSVQSVIWYVARDVHPNAPVTDQWS